MVDVYSCMVFVCMCVHVVGVVASNAYVSICGHNISKHTFRIVSLIVYSSYMVSILECECVIT